MIKAKVLAEALNRMVTSEVGKEARIQVKVNNQILDIVSMQMLENRYWIILLYRKFTRG